MSGHISGSSVGKTLSCPRTPAASNTVIAVGRLFSARQPSLWASSTLTGLNATGELAIDVREAWITWTRYGSALATGDFDGNGSADLAIGGPLREVGDAGGAGAVAVVYGQLFVDGFESGDTLLWSTLLP